MKIFLSYERRWPRKHYIKDMNYFKAYRLYHRFVIEERNLKTNNSCQTRTTPTKYWAAPYYIDKSN